MKRIILMGLIDIKALKVSGIQIRETGILFGVISVFLGLYTDDKYWFFVAIGILLVTLLIPILLKPLAVFWFGFSKALGWVTSRIVLFVIFFLLVVPMGLIRKAMGKDTMRIRQFKKGGKSAFTERNHEFTASDLKYPF
jgi:uncharacterized membrane protein